MGPFSKRTRRSVVFNKYRNTKVQHHAGMSFSSKLEAAVYDHLRLREMAGEINNIQCQDHVYLTMARILYVADFKYFDIASGQDEWAEGKGYPSDRWPTIKKLWKFYGPGKLTIYRGSYHNLGEPEIIIPKQSHEILNPDD